MVKAKNWIYCKEFDGKPNDSNFKCVEEELPALKDGEVLFEATYLTVDPYMRAHGMDVGKTAVGQQVCKVIESKSKDHPVGSEWLGYFGWRSHTICNPKETADNMMTAVRPLPPLGNLPHSLALGIIGMPGATAYCGLLKMFELKAGETVLVNGAAGAVGSVVGQLAKIKGCKVIGYAGTDHKVDWIKKELGFDYAFNYKTCDLSKTLSEAAPGGVDFYFDNVGGEFSNTVLLKHMNQNGRMALIGAISMYNAQSMPTGPMLYSSILWKRLRIRGMIVTDFPKEDWIEGFSNMIGWIKEGKLKYKEHVTVGFDNMTKAFFGLFSGDNVGKAIVKV